MNFIVDKQTMEDLNMLGKFNPGSIFNIFNRTKTREGEQLLERMFQMPLRTAEKINERVALFRYFEKTGMEFPFSDEIHSGVEGYLRGGGKKSRLESWWEVVCKRGVDFMNSDRSYELFCDEVRQVRAYLQSFKKLLSELSISEAPGELKHRLEKVAEIFQGELIQEIDMVTPESNGIRQIARMNYLFRSRYFDELQEILALVRDFDVYIAISAVAKEKGFTYPVAEEGNGSIELKNVYHPSLDKAVRNSLSVDEEMNVIFLTGANMAGKSTLMKSFSIAVFLAHLGFPVAAEEMKFTPLDGMYTSINVPDNLNMGYSHFYAEVLRVKKVAEEVASGKKLLVVFDELFKGTNVKDAFDATVAVTGAFSDFRECFFIISTHIIEAGHTLKENHTNFQYVYVPTVMEGGVPKYTYKLKEGITDDRHGMIIVNNEHIVEIIKEAVQSYRTNAETTYNL